MRIVTRQKLLERVVTKSDRAWHVEALYTLYRQEVNDFPPPNDHLNDGHLRDEWRLRATVVRDNYYAQSYAKVEVWSTTSLRWEAVVSLGKSEMRSLGETKGRNNVPNSTFGDLDAFAHDALLADEQVLMVRARMILAGSVECEIIPPLTWNSADTRKLADSLRRA